MDVWSLDKAFPFSKSYNIATPFCWASSYEHQISHCNSIVSPILSMTHVRHCSKDLTQAITFGLHNNAGQLALEMRCGAHKRALTGRLYGLLCASFTAYRRVVCAVCSTSLSTTILSSSSQGLEQCLRHRAYKKAVWMWSTWNAVNMSWQLFMCWLLAEASILFLLTSKKTEV